MSSHKSGLFLSPVFHVLKHLFFVLSMIVAFALNAATDTATVSIKNLSAVQNEKTLKVDISYDVSAVGLKGKIPEVTTKILASDGTCLWFDVQENVPAKKHISLSWDAQGEWPRHLDENAQVKVTVQLEEPEEATMVKIPGGSVKYWKKYAPWGDGNDEKTWWYSIGEKVPDGDGWEECTHRFDSFWMDETEVTWGMWNNVTAWGTRNRNYVFSQTDQNALVEPWAFRWSWDRPVEGVTSQSAMLWCNARSEMDGKSPLYYSGGQVLRESSPWTIVEVILPKDMSKAGYRVPTDYEWEHAGRGGLVEMLFPWGNDYSTNKCNCPPPSHRHTDYDSCQSSWVKSFEPNDYGLYDMAGNVAEFVHHASLNSDHNGLQCDPNVLSYHMGGSYMRMWDTCFVEESYFSSFTGAGAGFRSICLSEPPGVGGRSVEELSAPFVIDTRVPEVVDWNCVGKETHVEQDVSSGTNLTDRCLVAGMGFVLSVTLNEYKRERYPIRRIVLRGEGEEAPATKCMTFNWSKNLVPDDAWKLELADMKLPTGAGYHGKYKFSLDVAFEKVAGVEMKPKELHKKVFFDKNGRDNGKEPNWFVYWKEDGAVPGLLYGEQYQYSNVAGAVSIGHIGELEKVLLLGNDKNRWGAAEQDPKTGHVTGHVILHALAAEEHYFKYYPTLEAGGIEFCRPWVYGIYTVANVIAHEQKHIELYQSYVSDLESKGIEYPPQDREGCLRVKEMNSDYDYDSVFSIDSLLDKIRFRAKIAGFPFGSIGFPFGSMVFTKNDYMTDDKEMEINATIGRFEGFKLDRDKVDTFDLGTKKNPSYSRYGDNEFMAMLAGYIANRDEGTAIEANDWAYPGHQSYLPINVVRKSASDSGIVVQSLTRTTPLCTHTVETEGSIEEPFMASNGVITVVNGGTVSCGEDDFIRYQLSFDVTGSMMVRFVGYLIDSGSNVVSCAGTTVDLTANNNSCELAFPMNEIVRSGFKGPYTLSGMIVYRVSGGDLISEGILREIETDWVEPAEPTPTVKFTTDNVSCSEGSSFDVVVSGGSTEHATSVQVFLSYQTAAAADLDLAKGMIDGVVPKGGLKFPLTLNWAAGEVTNRVITIPVKADKAVEADEVLTFQLAAAQEQDIGEASVCTVTLVDTNTAVTLQDGAMSATVKLTSKASKSGGAWNVAPGNMLDPDGSRGLYHAESPALATGGRSMLSAGPLSSGYHYFNIRFTGPVEEEKPSTVTVYCGTDLLGVIGHGSTLRDGWKICVSNEWNGVYVSFSGGRDTVHFVFTQGSDPTVHAEISCFRSVSSKNATVYKVLALPSDPSGGHVTGSGLYTKGTVVPLGAKPRPGWVFTGWYTYGTNETRRLWSNKANVSGRVVDDCEIFAEFVRMPYIRALADPADGGKASGSGYCAAGKKVALKATANRNFTFAGWYAAGAPDAPVATTPTLVLDRSAKPAKGDARQTVLADVDGDATYFARFVGDPEVSVAVSATDGRGAEPAGKGAGRYVAGTVTGAGRYAPGKKAVLKATANRGYVFAGWREAGADGTLSRSAAYTIGAMPPDDVALVAAFVTADEDRESVAASLGGLPLAPWVSKTETHALATNVRAGVYLEWPLAASALSETTVKVAGLPAGLRFAAKPVTSRSGTGRSAVLVTNVPANTVYGAPTAASRTVTDRRTGAVTVTPSAVKVTVTTAGRSSRTYQIDTTVDPLPAWAQGTFAGVSYADADGAETNGLAAVSVTAAGKVSARQTAAGRAASFTAPWYDRHDAAEDAYHATLTAKVGAAVVTNRIAVYPAAHAATDAVPAETALGVMRGDLLDAWQTDWRREPWKGFAAALARTRPPLAYAYEVVGEQPGTVALKFGANGAVTAAGTFATGVDARGRETTAKASCSATLLPQGGDRYLVFVYFPPKGTFRGHARCLALVWDGEGFAEDVAW